MALGPKMNSQQRVPYSAQLSTVEKANKARPTAMMSAPPLSVKTVPRAAAFREVVPWTP